MSPISRPVPEKLPLDPGFPHFSLWPGPGSSQDPCRTPPPVLHFPIDSPPPALLESSPGFGSPPKSLLQVLPYLVSPLGPGSPSRSGYHTGPPPATPSTSPHPWACPDSSRAAFTSAPPSPTDSQSPFRTLLVFRSASQPTSPLQFLTVSISPGLPARPSTGLPRPRSIPTRPSHNQVPPLSKALRPSIPTNVALPGLVAPSPTRFPLPVLKGVSDQPSPRSLPSPGHCEREAEAQKIVGLIVEQVIDDTVTPPLWVAWIRNRQTRRPQNKVVQGA